MTARLARKPAMTVIQDGRGGKLSETKFTPGPWKFLDETKTAGRQFRSSYAVLADKRQVTSMSWNNDSPWFPNQDQSRANAHLIAAAPELFEALEDAVRWLWGAYQEDDSLMLDARPLNCMSMNDMRAALAKALGGSL